jgi:hypothetical protein
MPPREERLAETQKRFRRANERLHERVGPVIHDEQRVPFLCECADDKCVAAVELTLQEYSHEHDDDSRFVILPGHPMIEGADVVSQNDRYAVVDKSAA